MLRYPCLVITTVYSEIYKSSFWYTSFAGCLCSGH